MKMIKAKVEIHYEKNIDSNSSYNNDNINNNNNSDYNNNNNDDDDDDDVCYPAKCGT